MKLRMRKNSIRLRLTRSEVAFFEKTGHLEEAVVFPCGTLLYALQRSSSAADTHADFVGDCITVTVPIAAAKNWTSTEIVGIEADSNGLNILVEKDFQCAHGPVDQDAFVPQTEEPVARNN